MDPQRGIWHHRLATFRPHDHYFFCATCRDERTHIALSSAFLVKDGTDYLFKNLVNIRRARNDHTKLQCARCGTVLCSVADEADKYHRFTLYALELANVRFWNGSDVMPAEEGIAEILRDRAEPEADPAQNGPGGEAVWNQPALVHEARVANRLPPLEVEEGLAPVAVHSWVPCMKKAGKVVGVVCALGVVAAVITWRIMGT